MSKITMVTPFENMLAVVVMFLEAMLRCPNAAKYTADAIVAYLKDELAKHRQRTSELLDGVDKTNDENRKLKERVAHCESVANKLHAELDVERDNVKDLTAQLNQPHEYLCVLEMRNTTWLWVHGPFVSQEAAQGRMEQRKQIYPEHEFKVVNMKP